MSEPTALAASPAAGSAGTAARLHRSCASAPAGSCAGRHATVSLQIYLHFFSEETECSCKAAIYIEETECLVNSIV